MKTTKIGFVGVGSISGIYLKNITECFQNVEVIGVCDLIRERAEKAVAQYNIPKLYENMEELFADPEVDIVLNITRPYQHFDVTMAALRAGKNVYTEKPLATTVEDGKAILALAKEKGLFVGGAPDTFMGAAIQTCRELIDSGVIGRVIGASAAMIGHGPESWHPDPEFFYQFGGGPLFDMGPYYITALTNLIGSVTGVSAQTAKSFPQRMITSEPHKGQVMNVEVATHICANLTFENGAVGTLMTTFDVYHPQGAKIEIYGTKGTLFVPDPNCFGGDITVYTENRETVHYPLAFDYSENSRALGLADMAKALADGRPYRASAAQIFHVLDVMESIIKSGEAEKAIAITSRFDRGIPLKKDLPHGELD